MKRIVALVLVIATAFSLSACCCLVDETGAGRILQFGQQDIQSNTANVKHTGKKITGTINATTLFSEGLALVMLKGNSKTVYCINTDGYIVFELERSQVNNYTPSTTDIFCDGYILIGGRICDTSGHLTSPEDVGATGFHSYCKGDTGYIIADVFDSAYNGTIKKLGVMNTDFQWIVEPTEEIYDAFVRESLGKRYLQGRFCNNGIYYDCAEGRKDDRFLDLKAGTIIAGDKIVLGPETWIPEATADCGVEFVNPAGEVMLELQEDASEVYATKFINKCSVVSFLNTDAKKYYYTIIDETGKFQFEPKETDGVVSYDGHYYIINSSSAVDKKVSICYDSNMNVLGSLRKPENATAAIQGQVYDNVIVVWTRYGTGYNWEYRYTYYKTDFTPLFESEQPVEE